jgi:hypothetical protein
MHNIVLYDKVILIPTENMQVTRMKFLTGNGLETSELLPFK